MARVNLLQVITKLELGGAQKHVLALLEGSDREKFNLFLFTAREGMLHPRFAELPSVKVHRSRFLERSINPLADILALCELYLYIKKENIHLVHTHSSKAGFLGRIAAGLAGVKGVLHTVHGWSFNDFQPGLTRWIFIQLERICVFFTDRLIVVSAHDRLKGLSRRIGREDQYRLIRYGIDRSEFRLPRSGLREEFGIGARELVVGSVSCFKEQKSPEDFIGLANILCARFPEARFVLIGDGKLRSRLEMLIRKYGLKDKVILAGWRNDVPRIMAAMDIFVLTSLWEGLPIACLEAMSASLPVVVTDTGGISEVIEDGSCGFLVDIRDINDMSGKVSRLLSDGALRKKIGDAARQRLEHGFSRSEMIDNNLALYQELVQPGVS